MPSESRYEELERYIQSGIARISRDHTGEGVKYRNAKIFDLQHRLTNFITEIRMLDREISLEAQEYWKKLPDIT